MKFLQKKHIVILDENFTDLKSTNEKFAENFHYKTPFVYLFIIKMVTSKFIGT